MAAITLQLDLPQHFLDLRTQRVGFVLLGAFLISFLFIRTSARLMRSPKVPWWPGSVTTGSGLHLHHLVWGIVLLLMTGFLSFVTARRSPWTELLAGGFGIGAGLTLDEFALWVYLRDVYWSEEGRSSFEAVVVATLIGGLIVLGFAPLDLANNAASVGTLVLAVGTDLLLATLAIVKGKPRIGLIGIFFPPVSLGGALRLASPRSLWARRLYPEGGRKRARATARWARVDERRLWFENAIAGAPEASPPPAGPGACAEPDAGELAGLGDSAG